MTTWIETVEHFKTLTDKLGKPIDTGVFDTVIALNMLGIRTTQSCEGHLDWGVPYPWIDIEPNIEQKYLLHRYLSSFYETRAVRFESMLIFHGYRMRSQGGAFSSLLSRAEQAHKLEEYRAEMASFTTFLKSLLPDCGC